MGNYHSRLRPPFVVTNVLLVIPSKLFGLVGGANLTRNGTETDETEFMFELFQVYDKVNGTNLANQFRNEIEAAKKQGKRMCIFCNLSVRKLHYKNKIDE